MLNLNHLFQLFALPVTNLCSIITVKVNKGCILNEILSGFVGHWACSIPYDNF